MVDVGISRGASASNPTRKMRKVFRDVCKIYRSILRIRTRDKKVNDCGKIEYNSPHKLRCHTTKYKFSPNSDGDCNSPLTEGFIDMAKEERVSRLRTRSHRRREIDDKSLLSEKTAHPLTRTWSKDSTPTKRSSSSLSRCMSSSKIDFTRSLSRNLSRSSSLKLGSSNLTPIVFSSSSCNNFKPQPTEEELECTLEELCTGCTKKIKITREVLDNTGQVTEEEEVLKIKVNPGWRNGTMVTFEGKGNEAIGAEPADLVFVIVEKKHDVFTREGDDLETDVEIPLVEALTGSDLSISLPDGETLTLCLDEVIPPNSLKIIEGRGMPDPTDEDKRGDLRIRFRVSFPIELTDDQREKVRRILEDST